MTKLDYLFKQYENILGWYKQSEEKAKFLVTLNTLIVGVVNGLVFVGADKAHAYRLLYTRTSIWILLGLVGLAMILSFLFVLRAMWPRHHSLDQSLKVSERIWFFGDLASMTRAEHNESMESWSEQNLEATMITQNRILSINVWIKHEALNWAASLTILALVLIFVVGIVYGILVTRIPPSA